MIILYYNWHFAVDLVAANFNKVEENFISYCSMLKPVLKTDKFKCHDFYLHEQFTQILMLIYVSTIGCTSLPLDMPQCVPWLSNNQQIIC